MFDPISNPIKTNVHRFGVLMLAIIGDYTYHTLVIDPNEC